MNHAAAVGFEYIHLTLCPSLASVVFLALLAQDKTATYGRSNAQILGDGAKRWYDLYTTRGGGESTASMSSAEALYGEALAWRNDKFGKARIGRLRKLLQDAKNDAVGVGYRDHRRRDDVEHHRRLALRGRGGYLYVVLAKKGKAPKRRVSDVEKAYARLRAAFRKSDSGLPEFQKEGPAALVRLRRDLDGAIARRRASRAKDRTRFSTSA